MRKKIFIFISILLILTLTGCANQTSVGGEAENKNVETQELQSEIKKYEEDIKKLEEDIKKLEEKNDDYKLEIKQLEKEKNEYNDFIDKTIKYLDEDALLEIARSEWKYQIEVDEKPIPLNGKVEINKDTFKIVYSVESSLLSNVQEELFSKGPMSGDFIDHLKVVGIKPNNIGRTDGTVITAFVYEFESLPKNTNFKLEISDELKERLDLETNTINIQVN
ncbi:hypothetical protein GOQ29_05695 [Clostridium sp. D2Q-14]|uniref:coiled-coil domain-containing protein n=1 Tax=Anaeromonas gelatinilytica TaxID=2683194 RepID=UPI00193AFDF9|nr:hypothetical protein [Anaeromonas gelatinilytica]MBS4535111.1 hypothetical protein [Anaeromonas gelatinilytica]